ncbi:MAG: TonB family protein, partial [Bacteroidota bacterium]
NKPATRLALKQRKDDLVLRSFTPGEDATAGLGYPNKKAVVRFQSDNPKTAFKVVDQMPYFASDCDEQFASYWDRKDCGNKAMLQFIYKHLKYPASAKAAGIEGQVIANFVVNADGTISNAKIIRAIDEATSKEVLRLLKKMNETPGRWVPGRHEGRLVKVEYNLPVRFRLESTTPDVKTDKSAMVAKQLQLESFRAFPNPTENLLNVKFQSAASPVIVTLTDITGKEIFRESLNNFNGSFDREINVTNAAKGTLLLTIFQNEKVFTSKVVRQ